MSAAIDALNRARKKFGAHATRHVELLLYVDAIAREIGLPLRLGSMPTEDALEDLLVYLDAVASGGDPCALAAFVVHPHFGIFERQHLVLPYVSDEPVAPKDTWDLSRALGNSHVPIRLVVDERCARHFDVIDCSINGQYRLGPWDTAPATFFTKPEWPPLGHRIARRGDYVRLVVRNVSAEPQLFSGAIVTISLGAMREMPSDVYL